jgi:hypothetical protein
MKLDNILSSPFIKPRKTPSSIAAKTVQQTNKWGNLRNLIRLRQIRDAYGM